MTNQQSKILPSHSHGSQVHPQAGLPVIQQNDNLLISGNLLHKKLKVQTKFSMWFKRRIEKYGFEINSDYFPNLGKTSKKGGRPNTDYFLSLDMAKEMAMLEETETGRQIRRYFIQAEKAAKGVSQLPKEKDVFKGVQKKRINDRVMYLYTDLKGKLGYKCRRSSGGERHRYWMHFVKEGNLLYCTEEYALHKFHSRRVYNNRNSLKAMQPVLPLNFGDTAQLTAKNKKGGRS